LATVVEERKPAYCAQCRSRCGCTAVLENGRLDRLEPLPGHPTGKKLCPKGLATPELVYHPDRLTTPLRRTSPKGVAPATWEPLSWDEALDVISARMADLKARHGAEQVAFSITTGSGTHISDSIAWIERLVRRYGSPNTIYGTEICNWHKDFASRFTFGWDIGVPDFAGTDLIILWGNNPAATWLARSVEVQQALKRGAKLIVVDPRPTFYARQADCWLRVHPGTDQALVLAIAHRLLARGTFDGAFTRTWTNAPLLVRDDTGRFLRESDLDAGGSPDVFVARNAAGEIMRYDGAGGVWLDAGDPELFGEAVVDTLNGAVNCRTALTLFREAAAEWPSERAAGLTGVPVEMIDRAADLIANASSVAYYAWNGVGQSATATQTDRALSILYALTGSYGAPGGNVPGAAARFADISGQEFVSPEQRARTLGLDARPIGPGRSGWVTARDVYRAILERDPYPVRMLVSFGGNLLAAQPDTALGQRALEALEFHVHTDFFLNPSAVYADIVLPAATSWEREALRTGFDVSLEGQRRVQLRPPTIAPVGEARSDTDIAMALALRLGMAEDFFGGDVDAGHDAVLAPAGLSVAALREAPEGVDVPGYVPFKPFEQVTEAGVPAGFPTPTKRIEIYSETFLDAGQDPVPGLAEEERAGHEDGPFPLTLTCAKHVAFCHSQHRNIPSLRRLHPDPLIEVAPATAAARGVANGDWVDVVGPAGTFAARCRTQEGLAEGIAVAHHGWWFDGSGPEPGAAMPANMNRAIPTAVADPVSGSIPLRHARCEIRHRPSGAPASHG
jgi:anaerobic selenocysteine-containing dehydrogenase